MKANNYISKTEHRLLLILSFTVFVFVLSVVIFLAVTEIQLNGQYINQLAVDRIETSLPGFHFLTIFIFAALLKSKRFILPFLLTVFYVFCIIYGLYLKFENSMFGGLEISSIRQVRLVAHNYDYLALSFVLILLFWQISILLRMLIKTLQRKTELP